MFVGANEHLHQVNANPVFVFARKQEGTGKLNIRQLNSIDNEKQPLCQRPT